MKKVFYGVMTEFYKNGTFKGAITTRNCKEKPKNTQRFMLFMTAYLDWFESVKDAEAFLTKQSADKRTA